MGGLDRATEFDPRLRETRDDLSHQLLGNPLWYLLLLDIPPDTAPLTPESGA